MSLTPEHPIELITRPAPATVEAPETAAAPPFRAFEASQTGSKHLAGVHVVGDGPHRCLLTGQEHGSLLFEVARSDGTVLVPGRAMTVHGEAHDRFLKALSLEIPPNPYRVYLPPATGCKENCIFCDYRRTKVNALSHEQILAIADELMIRFTGAPQLTEIHFTERGEPMNNLDVVMSTAAELIARGAPVINVCIVAPKLDGNAYEGLFNFVCEHPEFFLRFSLLGTNNERRMNEGGYKNSASASPGEPIDLASSSLSTSHSSQTSGLMTLEFISDFVRGCAARDRKVGINLFEFMVNKPGGVDELVKHFSPGEVIPVLSPLNSSTPLKDQDSLARHFDRLTRAVESLRAAGFETIRIDFSAGWTLGKGNGRNAPDRD